MHKVALINFALSLALLLLFHFKPSFMEAVRLRVEDSLYLFQHFLGKEHEPHPDLVVVAVDEKSVNQLGRWPWSRQTMAELVQELSGANLVLFDMVFSEPAPGDKELSRALQETSNAIMGFFFRRDATKTATSEEADLLRDSELLRVKKLESRVGIKEFPFVELSVRPIASAVLAQAPFNSEPDPDGLYRRYPVAYMFQGSIFPSMALQAYRFLENKDLELVVSSSGIEEAKLGEFTLPLSNRNSLLLNFPSTKTVKVVPAVEVLQGKVSLKDKVVLVGATEIGIYDIRPTPLDPATPGVYLHYIALSNLLTRDLVRDFSQSLYVLVPFLGLLPLSFLALKKLRHRAVMYLTLLLSVFSACVLLFVYMKVYVPFFYPLLSLSFSYLTVETYLYYTSERRVGELKKAFSSYVSPQLLEIILKDPEKLKLGGEKREITVLFSDLRGFTTLSEGLDPEKLVSLLNEYLEPMTLIVLEEGGMLDKYIGDAIMAVFNAPLDLPQHRDRACRTALRMVRRLKELNAGFKAKFGLELNVGIGINTGYAVVGNMGSRVRFDYTAIGDTVNLASRLEGLNKLYNTNIILSQFTAKGLEEEFLLRPLDRVAVKGKSQAVLLYELMEDTPNNRLLKELYERALDRYFKGHFEEAMIEFEELVLKFNDGPSEAMLKRCRQLVLEPPERWEGVYVAKEK
ncbi:MAG: adenylate/guanylate cyclase domain-containing protein [Aquificaceae bacterium]|nr:adenylate/guanylate cyclase domain-containing protein [Aquificaceae bacterium]MDW8097090.1 adenylate/guanylate cyclase domain-containing protein [Aquificaceae bacterium]